MYQVLSKKGRYLKIDEMRGKREANQLFLRLAKDDSIEWVELRDKDGELLREQTRK